MVPTFLVWATGLTVEEHVLIIRILVLLVLLDLVALFLVIIVPSWPHRKIWLHRES